MSLSPENRKLVERVYGPFADTARFSADELNRLLDASRSAPPLGSEQDDEDGGDET